MNPNDGDDKARHLELPDGRRLCFAEYGDPEGQPVFVFHGNPNSRLMWGLLPGSPFLPGVRLIAPDRPGFGQSEFREGITTVENWPNDVITLADSLGIDRFTVFGPSGGGPFALSCAWKIPQRLTAVGVFASVGPLNPQTAAGLAEPIRVMWKNAPSKPRLFRMQMKMAAFIARRIRGLYINLVLKEFSKTDREVYERLNIARLIQADRDEGYRQGGIGTWYDAMIPVNWPIALDEISTKVFLWQGEEDISVSPAMGRYLAEKIPDCEARYIQGAGHFWIFEHMTEMLETLLTGILPGIPPQRSEVNE